jgi:pyrimidine-specific ribonucleoside hydrolase
MNIIFDMETGDPDDLITLLLLLINSDVQLQGITCYQGSPIQIGLIKHVLTLANKEYIPIGGLNSIEPSELSPYYSNIVGTWDNSFALQSPTEVLKEVFTNHPDTHLLTGAPLTNIANFLKEFPNLIINKMTTQGGYLGDIVNEEQKLSKFKDRKEIRTYNLTNDTDAFTIVNSSKQIKELTYVTKDLCHGFLYSLEIHNKIIFNDTPIQNLLKKCLEYFTLSGKGKAMHDPLAMLIMLYPELGETIPINMNFNIDKKGHSVFSSQKGNTFTKGLIGYENKHAWEKFSELCSFSKLNKLKI